MNNITKIKISCVNGKVTFSTYNHDKSENISNLNLTQTNIINTESMIFSSNYLLKNPEIVTTFLIGIASQRNINKVYINDYEIISSVLLIIQDVKSFNELYLKPNQSINYDIYEKILYSSNIKFVSCYSMKHFMLEKLDQKGVTVIINENIDFNGTFMNDNNLNNYSSIYYKRLLNIDHNMSKADLEDFEIFCRINKYLKTINFHYFSQEVIRLVIKYLIKYKIKNVKIYIYENAENNKYLHSSVEFLHLIKKELHDDFRFSFKIIYSEEYKKNNFLAQVTINNIKLMTFTIIVVVSAGFLVMEYNGYESEKNIDQINKLIDSEVIRITDKHSSDITSSEPISSSNDGDSSSQINVDTNLAYQNAFKEIFNVLKNKNQDTVGWLKVNNTLIEYPIVQTTNNEYYLKNDFYKEKNIYGWVFMDYRNNPFELKQNTILYGHNSRKKVAFGTLKYTLEEEWYLNKDNQIITFNTLADNMEWQIFSIYVIDVTSDYLYVDFRNQEEFLKFANKLKNRSIQNFDVLLEENDKILTLSTCTNNSKQRIVVHAKLINKKQE